ncbi:uncharacterized protein METZ01_LOCUS58904, partial [marine metagenome]
VAFREGQPPDRSVDLATDGLARVQELAAIPLVCTSLVGVRVDLA